MPAMRSVACGRENISAGATIFGKGRLGALFAATLCLTTMPAFAQALRLSSASGIPGQTVSIRVELISPKGKEPAALEWEVRASHGQLTPELEGATAENKVARQGKTLRCAVREDGVVCVLFGGRQEIANGPVATLAFTIPREAVAGKAQLRLVRAVAVTADSQRMPIRTAESQVRIRAR